MSIADYPSLKRKLRDAAPKPIRAEWHFEADLGHVFRCWGLKLETPNRRSGEHWSARKRTQDTLNLLVAQRDRPRISGRAFVSFWRFYGGMRACDEDNLKASLKPALDALRYACVIVNDDPGSIELHAQQQRRVKDGPEWLVIVRPAS